MFENPIVACGSQGMSNGRLLIFGNGQLANAFDHYFSGRGWTVVRLPRELADVRVATIVEGAVAQYSPDVVLNCAAKTNIDWCEKEENRLEAVAVNANGAGNIANAAAKNGAFFVHISSGCIQESIGEHDVKREDDPLNPLCYYAWTKVWGEQLVTDAARRRGLRALILRPRQLINSQPSRVNALVKMLTYRELIDTANSCTVVEDLLRATAELLTRGATGIFNVVNPGVTSPLRIAQTLKAIIKPDMEFRAIVKAELNKKTFATRIDAVLSSQKLREQGVILRPIEERLPEVIAELKRNLESTEGKEILSKVMEDTRAKLSQKAPAAAS